MFLRIIQFVYISSENLYKLLNTKLTLTFFAIYGLRLQNSFVLFQKASRWGPSTHWNFFGCSKKLAITRPSKSCGVPLIFTAILSLSWFICCRIMVLMSLPTSVVVVSRHDQSPGAEGLHNRHPRGVDAGLRGDHLHPPAAPVDSASCRQGDPYQAPSWGPTGKQPNIIGVKKVFVHHKFFLSQNILVQHLNV